MLQPAIRVYTYHQMVDLSHFKNIFLLKAARLQAK